MLGEAHLVPWLAWVPSWHFNGVPPELPWEGRCAGRVSPRPSLLSSGVKTALSFSPGFVLLGGLFPEGLWRVSTAHGQAHVAAVVRKGLLFGLKPFEVVICLFLFCLMEFFLSTGHGLVLFSLLFLDLFEITSYFDGCSCF